MSHLSKLYRLELLNSIKKEWFLLFVAFLFILLRAPSLAEPHWYGDEGIYQVVGREISRGVILYKEVWDNKPPLLYIIYAFFDGNLFLVKLASLFFGLFSIFTFFLLSTKIFEKNYAYYIATFFYAFLLAIPILEGNIANAENFMLLPITLAAYFVLQYKDSKEIKKLIFAGLLLGIASIIKVVALFDFFAFFAFLVILFWNNLEVLRKKVNLKVLKPIIIFSLSFIFPFLITSFYFLLINAFPDFLRGVFSDNIDYINVENKFLFPLGILSIKTLILVSLIFAIFKHRNRLAKNELFIYLWTIFALYNAFFSQRPYIHYLLVILPVASLLVGGILEFKKRKALNILIISFIAIVAYSHFTIYKKNISYYINYLQFIVGNKSATDYQRFFDPNTPRDYEISNFIVTSLTQEDNVFLWSDSAQIYALANKSPIGRYIVAYHITFYKDAIKETKLEIENKKPKYIIQTASIPPPNELLTNYKLRYEMTGAKIYEREI